MLFLNEQNHRFSYNEPMGVESMTQALCDLALRFGEGDDESIYRGISLIMFLSCNNFCFVIIHDVSELLILLLARFKFPWFGH